MNKNLYLAFARNREAVFVLVLMILIFMIVGIVGTAQDNRTAQIIGLTLGSIYVFLLMLFIYVRYRNIRYVRLMNRY
jgi:hypothetical protein